MHLCVNVWMNVCMYGVSKTSWSSQIDSTKSRKTPSLWARCVSANRRFAVVLVATHIYIHKLKDTYIHKYINHILQYNKMIHYTNIHACMYACMYVRIYWYGMYVCMHVCLTVENGHSPFHLVGFVKPFVHYLLHGHGHLLAYLLTVLYACMYVREWQSWFYIKVEVLYIHKWTWFSALKKSLFADARPIWRL